MDRRDFVTTFPVLAILTATMSLVIYSGCASVEVKPEHRNHFAPWIALSGVENVAEVAPGYYRGAQPSEEGMQALEQLGVRTVLNLRHYHSDKDEVEGTGLRLVEVPLHSTRVPKDEEIRRIFAVLLNENVGPVYLHCLHGSDRTGCITAMYRVVVEGWPKQRAVAEMQEFGSHGIHAHFRRFILELDVERWRKELNVSSGS